MTESGMPRVRSGEASNGSGGWSGEWIEIAGAIVAGKVLSSREVLQRETKRVKFNRNVIITREFTDRDKVFNDGGCKESIFELVGAVG